MRAIVRTAAANGITGNGTASGLDNFAARPHLARPHAGIFFSMLAPSAKLEEACSRYMLTVEEFLSWQYSIDQYGLAGLRTRQIPANNSGHNRRAGTRRRKRRQPADLLPQLPPGAPKAKDAADGAAVITDLVIIRPALAVMEDRAAKGEHMARGWAAVP